MIWLLALVLAQPATLNLNQQPIMSRQNGGRLSTQRQYAIDCYGGTACSVDGGVLRIWTADAGAASSSGGAPVDGGFVVWTSVGSTNERLLSNGTNTTIDTATPGQIQVDLSGTIAQSLGGTGTGALTCAAGERLTSNGTVYSCSALPAGGSSDYDGGYNVVQDEGVDLTKRTTIDFTGAGVTCTDTGAKTQCTISGGGSGGTSPYVLSFGGF
jgi:hypothetical protein